MAEAVHEAPYTLEGAWMLHQYFRLEAASWNRLDGPTRRRLVGESAELLEALNQRGEREEAGGCYRIHGHKADLGLIHLRQTPEELLDVERRVTHLPIHPYLREVTSYLSVVELSVHGVSDRHGPRLRQEGLEPDTPEWEAALEEVLKAERERMRARLFPEIPQARYNCFYPMSKRRGERDNWYALSSKERGAFMRGHARVGRRYTDKVTQIISASTGLDDWEWGVDLFADDPVLFKKLIYEMRFDEASSRFAEFGPFLVGLRAAPGELLEA